ncbi:MAG: DUF4446 family protein [Thermanaeromonas sp.]|uniref:DUF4446 family protein n=1 Tax=Thermanaeromonas sp. TaxID=2003697 RepID=UPI00243D214B|nr:DUF4446 family protein [Thermanaeromonas sp.]MCG0277057.1 DUF4446 family protein [Thermanaeromonas sp.]
MLAQITRWAEFIYPYIPYISAMVLVAIIILTALTLYATSEIKRLDRRLRRLAGAGEGEDIKEVLERFRDIKDVKNQMDRLEEKIQHILENLENALCRVGMVRFNAFSDTGSELSFALAVLSKEGDGFILTSLYSRDETRVFLKPVKRGRPLYRLSEEEEKALQIALGYITA